MDKQLWFTLVRISSHSCHPPAEGGWVEGGVVCTILAKW
jgi:hypothetical protein